MIIAIDLDGPVIDLATVWLDKYNKDYGDSLTPADITSWDTSKFVKPSCGKKIFEYLDEPELYDNAQAVDGAIESVQELREKGHRVIFVTSTPNKSAGRKFRWLKEHGFLDEFGYRDYYECNDKSLIRADILLDDAIHNVETFPGTGVIFDEPWNKSYSGKRVFDWYQFMFALENGEYGPHPTERNRPEQTKAFRELIEKMYSVHLDKNQDYSPANILGTGEIGLTTRIWDKVSRLMNLTGFRVEIGNSRYETPSTPKNESIDDTILDLAVYAIIYMLYRKGVWGR